MSIIKTKSRGINLADNFAITGTVSGAGIDEIDQWELPTSFDDGSTAIADINTWQRASAATSTKIGIGMTMDANGIFSFPKTGVWIINLDTMYVGSSSSPDDPSLGVKIYSSTDAFASQQSTIGTAVTSMNYFGSANMYVGAHATVIFNCTNISTHKIRFKTDSVDSAHSPSAIDVLGVAGDIHTGILFQRVGNAQ